MLIALGAQKWLALAVLAALILLDAILAWVKNAAHGTFSWSKFGMFVRKQCYVLGAAILLAVTQKYGPPSLQALSSVTWWAGAIAVGLQYVVGDILGDKLGLLGAGSSGLPPSPPGVLTSAPKAPSGDSGSANVAGSVGYATRWTHMRTATWFPEAPVLLSASGGATPPPPEAWGHSVHAPVRGPSGE